MSNPKIRLKRGTNTQVTGYASSAVAGEVLVDPCRFRAGCQA